MSKAIEPLTETIIAEMEEIFKLFDKDNDGLVANSEFGTMIRALNMNPSEEEVTKLVESADPEHTGSFSRDSFFTIATKRGKDTDTFEDLLDAFKILNKDNGKEPKIKPMQESWFKLVMTTYSEKLKEKEVEEVLTDLDVIYVQPSDNQKVINYEDLAKLLMNK